MQKVLLLGFVFSTVFIFSCQRNLFKTTHLSASRFGIKAQTLNQSQRIEKFDHLAISVFTRKGEILIDPEGVLEIKSNLQNSMFSNPQQMALLLTQQFAVMANNMRPQFYVVNEFGEADLPAIGKIRLEGLTLTQTDSLLSREYESKGFYKDAYVKVQYLNKRVVVLGALGDRVVKIPYENMTVFEILAQQQNQPVANLISIQSYARGLLIIRNLQTDPNNLEIEEIDLRDLSSIYLKNLIVKNGDVIYVRPRRRFDREVIGDFSFIASAITSLATLYLLIDNIRKR